MGQKVLKRELIEALFFSIKKLKKLGFLVFFLYICVLNCIHTVFGLTNPWWTLGFHVLLSVGCKVVGIFFNKIKTNSMENVKHDLKKEIKESILIGSLLQLLGKDGSI
jgi:hypothetical protein